MKKTLVKAMKVIAGFAMVFGLTGCADQKSEIEKELESYTQYNHIIRNDIKNNFRTNYYATGEDEDGVMGYDWINACQYQDLEGYDVVITGINSCSLKEDSEDNSDNMNKVTKYLDRYTYKATEESTNEDIASVVALNTNYEYEATEEDGKKIYTAVLDEDDKYKSITYVFEDSKITKTTVEDNNGEDYIEEYVFTFDNVDDDYYSNMIKAIKECDGLSRAQVKEKIGQYVEDNKEFE